MNPLQLIEKYYPAGTDIHYILVTHSEQVRNKALEIAAKHPELNLDTTFIAEAAMLHDIGIFKCNAVRIHCHGSHQYIEHGYLGADLLREEGFPRHALVCERHTGVGLSLETIKSRQLPIPQRDMLPVSMEEQVICYADKFFSKTQLHEMHDVERIKKHLQRHCDEDVEQFEKWLAIFE